MEKIKQVWQSKQLRNKILFSIGIIVVYRLLAQISIPGINLAALKAIFEQNQFFSVLSILTGGSAENFSIVLMGLGPYINASIIVQLLTVVIPKFESLSKEGEQGQKTLNSYTRWLTLPLALLQSYAMIAVLNSQSQIPILPNIQEPGVILPVMLTVTAGTVLLVWLGELISEKGIGNGISLLIFAGIVATVPAAAGQSILLASQDPTKLIPVVSLILLVLGLLIATVLMAEAYREIPVSYASRSTKGQLSKLPIKINQAGMIPIIFAVSITSFPNIVAQLVQQSSIPVVKAFSDFVIRYFTLNSPLYLASLFFLIIGFTYFYVSITFKPEQVAENIQKRGGYIPGIRPGKETSDYLSKVSNRLNLFGGLFVALIATLPIVVQIAVGGSSNSIPLLISGAGMLIIVGVVLDLMKQVNAQLIMHDYDKLY
jgi:preprotein translocase subunit SecY